MIYLRIQYIKKHKGYNIIAKHLATQIQEAEEIHGIHCKFSNDCKISPSGQASISCSKNQLQNISHVTNQMCIYYEHCISNMSVQGSSIYCYHLGTQASRDYSLRWASTISQESNKKWEIKHRLLKHPPRTDIHHYKF